MTDHAPPHTVDRRSALKLVATAIGGAGLGRALTFSRAHAEGDPIPDIDITVSVEGAPNLGPAISSIVLEDVIFSSSGNESSAIGTLRQSAVGGALGLSEDRRASMTMRVDTGSPGADELRAWLDSCEPRQVTVVVNTPDGSRRTYDFFECWPTAYATGGLDNRSDVACETVVCKMGRVELA